MGAKEGDTFPHVNVDVGKGLEQGVLAVKISLPEFEAELLVEADAALTIGTPVPGPAKDILRRAVAGCGTCYLHQGIVQPVGRGAGALCEGFSELGDDLFQVIAGTDGGHVTVKMGIAMPPDARFSPNVPILMAPCGVRPFFLLESYIEPSE